MLLNVLIFADFGRWLQSKVKTFIELIDQFVDASIEQNMMYKCYNPILVICICSENLTKIGNAISMYAHRGKNLTNELLNLGEQLIAEMDEEGKPDLIENIFMDTDFLDRRVLKLIADFEYEPLLRDNKISALLDRFWIGKDSYDCDGKMTDFSKLAFLANSPIKNLPHVQAEFKSLLGMNFEVFTDTQSFQKQYKFRKSSIDYIFTKELISTCLIGMILIWINFQYLFLFNMT